MILRRISSVASGCGFLGFKTSHFDRRVSRREAYLGSAMVISNDQIKGFRRAYMLKVMRLDRIPDYMPFVEEFGVVSPSNRAQMTPPVLQIYKYGEIDQISQRWGC